MDYQKKVTRNSKLAICPECSQQFIFKDYLKKKKQPLLIGCGHSACESCIRSAVTAKRDIVCKFCGFTKPFEPEMADDLLTFFPIDQFTVGRLIRGSSIGNDNSVEFRKNVRKTQATASTKKKCSECSIRVEEVKCKQCDVPYCEDCFDSVHGSARSLRSHEKLPLPIDVTQIRSSIEIVPCPQHNDVNQDFYCKTCSLQLCSRCALLSHGQHEIVLLHEQNKLKEKALNEALEKANRIYKRLQFTKKKAQASLSSSDQSSITDYSQVKSEISMHFQRLHGLLQIRENYLLNLVSNLENYQINSLHDVIDQLSTSLMDAELVLREAREAMRPEKFKLIDANIILRSLQEVCSMPCFLLPSDYSETNDQDTTEKMGLKFMVDDQVDATLKDYGTLTTPSRTKFVLKSEEDLPADYRADPVPEEMELEPFLLDDHQSVSSAGGGRGGSVGGGGGDSRMSASLSDISASSSSVRVLDVMHTRRESSLGVADAESPDAPIWMLKTGCPRNDLSPGTIEEVTLCHIRSPSLFYVHRKRVNVYMEQIRRLIGRALHQRAPPTEVKPGWIYLAKYSADNRWYRAKVLKFYDENKIHAHFIDFGNDEYITLTNIEYSTEKIQEIPALATACKLHLCKPSPGPEWDPNAIKMMAAMCKSSTTIRMHVMENKDGSGRPVEVDLRCFVGGTHSLLRDTLLFHEFATHTSTTNYTQLKSLMLQSQYNTKTNAYKPGSAFDSVVTYIKDPSNFYVNPDMIYYDRLMGELNAYYRHPLQAAPKFFYPSKGMAVAVFDEQHCGWFRAKVLGHPGNQTVELFYVDIGQTAVVKWESIRVLENKFLRASQLAVKCELYNVVPITGSGWTAATNEALRKMVLGQRLRVNVVEENDATGLSVVLYRTINLQEVCINGQLIEQQLAASASIISPFTNHRERKALLHTPPGKKKSFEQVITKPGYKSARTRKYRSLEAQISPSTSIRAAAVSPKPMSEEEKEKEAAEDEHLKMHEKRFPCTIIKIFDPSHFYITFNSEMLEKLKGDITDFYSNESNREKYRREEEWKEGDNCVFLNKDKAWYRATIDSILDDKAKLRVQDIMEEVTVATTELYNLKDEFNVMDRLFRCHMVDVRAPGDRGVWPSITTEEFEKQVTTRGKVYFSQKGEVDEERRSIPAVLSLKSAVEEVGALEPAVAGWYTVNELLVDMGLALPDSHMQDRLVKSPLLESLMGTKNLSPKGDTKTAKHANETSEGSVKSESETSSSLLSSGAISKKKKESKNKKQASQYVTPDISDWLPPEPLHSLKFATSATYVDMDANIYIQDTTSADTLRIIGAALQSKYENSRPSPHDSFWSAGQLCVAKYHADQKWYRGKVMEVLADNRYRVVMVDYGNVEEVKAADMRKNLLMTQVPRQCHPCALKRVRPLSDDDKWPIEVLDQIHGYIVDRQCEVELAGTCGDYSVVDIEVLPGESLIGLLIRLNCAVLADTNGNARDDDDDDDDSSTVSSSSCSSEEVLIEKEVVAATDDSDAKKSAAASTKSSDQESEMTNQVRIYETIPSTFADLTIDEPNPNPAALKNSWLEIMEEEQNKALMDLQYRVIEPRYKSLVIPPHIEELEVEATAIVSATTFFGLVTETADVKMKRVEFTKMQAEMQEIAQDLPLIEMPTEKQVCCSKFQQDGYWYRAEILKVKDQTCMLRFVDYGNCECISINEIHELKPEWLDIPIQGVLMTLYNLRMAPNVDVKDCAKALNKCIFDKALTAKIKNYNPLLVEVFTQDGKSVNEELAAQPFYMEID